MLNAIYVTCRINCIKKTKLLPSIHSWYFVTTRCSIELKSMQVAEVKYINILIWLSSCLWYQRSILNESFLIHAPLNHNLGTGEGSQDSYHHSSSAHPHVMNKWRILNGGCQEYINILIWLSSCLWSNEEIQYKNRNLAFGHKTLHASLISQRC
jgi:hypothetical protein